MNFLHLRDGQVVDQQNQPVYLRGVNIGGWMNMEHFLTGHPGSETNLRRVMAETLGPDKAAFFFERFLHHFFNEQDVQFLKSCGISAIRLPINYRHFESDMAPFTYLEAGFTRLDQVLDWCEANQIYVILDLHSVQGWQNGDWHCDNSSRHTLFWEQKGFQDRFVALWEAFATRYKDRAVIAAYNIMNEPLANAPQGRFIPDDEYQPNWPSINAIYQRTVEAIRAIDPTRIVIVEGDYMSVRFEGLTVDYDPHLMISNHNYIAPAVGTITKYPVQIEDTYWDSQYVQQQFKDTEGYRFSEAHNVPLLVGEFGLNMDYPGEDVEAKVAVFGDQLSTYNQLGCHWTFWSYKALSSMGWIQTASDSPYIQAIAPVLEAKEALGVDFGWLTGYPTALHSHMEAINQAILAHLPDIDPQTNLRYFGQAAMSTYTADQLQHLYAQQFVDKSEEEIDTILSSFALTNCVERVEMSRVIQQAATAQPLVKNM